MRQEQEAGLDELLSIYEQAREELAQLEGRRPLPTDDSEEALETLGAIERHRALIEELYKAMRAVS